MHSSEKEVVLRIWEQMDSAAIVKDVATKGKYINLSIAFLAKRMGHTVDQAKVYFQTEIDQYVLVLLSNGQVFRAEHLLKNLGRTSKYVFYEYLAGLDADRADNQNGADQEVKGSSSPDIIVKYLIKIDDQFEAQRSEYDLVLKMLKTISEDRTMREKFAGRLEKFSLEEVFKQNELFRHEMAADIFFMTQNTFVVPALIRDRVWTYLLERKQFGFIIKWINIVGSDEDSTITEQSTRNNQFENDLRVMFRHWSISEEMLEELCRSEVSGTVRDSLARHGMFLSDEREQPSFVLERIFKTESWAQNEHLLQEESLRKYVVEQVMEHDLRLLMVQDVCSSNHLSEMMEKYPTLKNDIKLCLRLRSTDALYSYDVSKEVSNYILKKDTDFYNQKPLIYLAQEILRNFTNPEPLSTYENDPILSRIPFVQSLLRKSTSPTIHDYQTTLVDMVKRFLKIDLNQIQLEAGDEPLRCSNSTLISKYGTTEKLEFIYYIKQCRSSFAVFVFVVGQLRLFSQISKGQIMYACSQVTNLALTQLDNSELVAHCMAFVEMLGIDSSAIRSHIKCVRLVCAAKPELKLGDLTEKEFRKEVVEVVTQNPNTDDVDALRVICEANGVQLSNSFLKDAFEKTDWFRGLAFASYFGYSTKSIVEVLGDGELLGIPSEIAANLVIALRYDCFADRPRRSSNLSHRRRRAKEGEANMVSSRETMSSSISSVDNTHALVPSKFLDQHSDLFAIILQCTHSNSTTSSASSTSSDEEKLDFHKLLDILTTLSTSANIPSKTTSTALNLFRRAIHMKWPILTVLAATLNIELRQFSWFSWLTMSTSWTPTTRKELLDLAMELIENCVSTEHVMTLHHSFQIFYPDHCFCLFTEYLHRTKSLDFSDKVTELLRSFLEAVHNPDKQQLLEWLPLSSMLKISIHLILLHVKHNIESGEHMQLILNSLCNSGIGDFSSLIDFTTLKEVNAIVSFSGIVLNIDLFRHDNYNDNQIRSEYERICDRLVSEQQFSKATQLADCLKLPKDNIIYDSWVWEWQTNSSSFDLTQCERDMISYSLAPEMVISFYTLVADKLAFEDVQKYVVLKRVLDVVKQHNLFPNESFNCDRVEFEMVFSFLRNSQTIDELDVYYSEYFESIMAKERFVLYKSFTELKEISGLDDLTVCNKKALSEVETKKLDDLIFKLLDVGDIVQALRLQAIFLHPPVDLHYLVFCMAIAEGLASLSDLTPEQEQMNREASKFAALRFNRRTLRPSRISQSSTSSSPVIKAGFLDTSDSCVALEFEEIPSRQKQDILNALQNFAARINHGSRLAQRIMRTWRAAMYLDQEYVDVLKTKDAYLLLESATREDCIYKLDVMNDIMCSMELTKQECADYLADKIAFAIIQSKFYIIPSTSNDHLHHHQHLNMSNPIDTHCLWGYDLDKEFRLFLELCPSTAALGNRLLQHCDTLKLYRKFDRTNKTNPASNEPPAIQEIFERLKQLLDQKILSHKKQNTICVELLIKAHDCFVHECYMEGIAWVLHRTKMLNVVLTNAKSWSLIVKMLMGVGRYREMYYCFETLIKNNQFEYLLGKFDEDRVRGLNQAIISYLREHCPENTEYYRLTALHFRMYTEIAQMWESEAKVVVTSVLAQAQFAMDDQGVALPTYKHAPIDETSANTAAFHLRCSPDLVPQLNTAMEGYAHAAENYLLDNKLAMAQTTASLAELIALQICLVRRAIASSAVPSTPDQPTILNSCVCVVNIVSGNMMKFIVNNHLSVSHSLILGRAYPSFEINWTDAIYAHYINGDDTAYLNEFCEHMNLTDTIIEALVKTFQHQPRITPAAEANVARLVEMVESVTLRYKLASLLGLKACIAGMINDHSLFYLKDTNYGRNEEIDK